MHTGIATQAPDLRTFNVVCICESVQHLRHSNGINMAGDADRALVGLGPPVSLRIGDSQAHTRTCGQKFSGISSGFMCGEMSTP